MPNKGRGEVELTVDGRTYVLRPAFETLSAIEDATDKGVGELILSITTSSHKFKDVVTTLWIAAKRSKNRDVPGLVEFGELIRTEMGMIPAARLMAEFLGNASISDKQLSVIEQEAENDTKDADPSPPSEEAKPAPEIAE